MKYLKDMYILMISIEMKHPFRGHIEPRKTAGLNLTNARRSISNFVYQRSFAFLLDVWIFPKIKRKVTKQLA